MSSSDDLSGLTTSLANLTVDGRQEVLELIDTDQEIVDTLLGKYSNSFRGFECPILNSKISKKLGGGNQGAAYLFDLDDGTTREYVIKVSPNPLFDVKEKALVSKTAKKMKDIEPLARKTNKVPDYIFYSLNGGNDVVVQPGGTYLTVKSTKKKVFKCLLSSDVVVEKYWNKLRVATGTYEREYTGETFLYPRGSYICDSPSHTEYVISLLCRDILVSEICINFLDIFGFSMCAQEDGLKDYTFMQRIHGDINQFADRTDLTPAFFDSILIQAMFAISAYKRTHNIQHNDLHCGNVFMEDLTRSTSGVLFRGQDVKKATHFEYIVDGTSLFVQNHNILVRIGDFGFSVAYGKKIIAPAFVSTHTSKQTGKNYPSWKLDSYDILLLASDFFSAFGDRCPMACRLLAFILDDTVTLTKDDEYEEAYYMGNTREDTLTDLWNQWYAQDLRPNFRNYPYSVEELITNPKIVGKETFVRPAGNVVLLGEV